MAAQLCPLQVPLFDKVEGLLVSNETVYQDTGLSLLYAHLLPKE